jgi:hypothetical protein
MTLFRKLLSNLIHAIEPQLVREHNGAGPRVISIDTRPFNVPSLRGHEGR